MKARGHFVALLTLMVATGLAGWAYHRGARHGAPWCSSLAVIDCQTGRQARLAAYVPQGKNLLICFFCGCDNCRRTARAIALLPIDAPVVAVVEMPPEAGREFAVEEHWTAPILFEPGGSLAAKYAGAVCPRAVVVGADGRLLARTSEEHTAIPPGSIDVLLGVLQP